MPLRGGLWRSIWSVLRVENLSRSEGGAMSNENVSEKKTEERTARRRFLQASLLGGAAAAAAGPLVQPVFGGNDASAALAERHAKCGAGSCGGTVRV